MHLEGTIGGEIGLMAMVCKIQCSKGIGPLGVMLSGFHINGSIIADKRAIVCVIQSNISIWFSTCTC